MPRLGTFVQAIVVSDSNIIAGTDEGIYISSDKGTSWLVHNTGLTDLNIHSLAISGTKFIAGTSSGIFISTDSCSNWTAENTGLTSLHTNSLAVIDDKIFAGTTNGIFLSTDNGTTWSETGMKSGYVKSLAVSGTTLICGDYYSGASYRGIYTSTDYGVTWVAFNSGIPSTYIRALAIQGENVFAGLDYIGMWARPLSDIVLPVELSSFSASVKASDVILHWNTVTEKNSFNFEVERKCAGNSWNKISELKGAGNSNFPKSYSYTDRRLKNGSYSYRLKMTDNDGTFRYSNEVYTKISIPGTFGISQNYPNPFNPGTTINFSLPIASYVTLSIYNSMGQEVENLISKELGAGDYTREWNAASFASGVYYYRIKAGNFMETKKLLLLK